VTEPSDHAEIDHSGVEGIGLSNKASWYASAMQFAAGPVAWILITLFTDLQMSATTDVLALLAGLGSVSWVICAKLTPDAKWGPYVRITFGIFLIGAAAFEIGGPVAMIVPIMIFPVLGSAFMHTPRIAIPYSLGAALVAAAAVYAAPPPATTIGAFVTLVALSSIGLAAIYTQHQLRTMAELHHGLSSTDALTGCANVRRLKSRLTQDLIGAAGSEHRVALLAIDLDDFKQVNDRFSHTKGDDLLKAVASALESELEAGDLLVRRGGDEFMVVAVGSAGRDLAELRDRLARGVTRARNEVCPQVNPNGSVGYVVHREGESADELLLRADDALHLAKLDAHPDRREEDGTTKVSALRRAIAAHPIDRKGQARAEEEEEVRTARWIARALGNQTAWVVAACLSAVLVSTFVIVELTGEVPGFRSAAMLGLIAAFAALAPLSLWASRRELSPPWLQGFILLVFVLLTLVMFEAGSFSADFVDLYVFPLMFAFCYLPLKRAIGFMAVSCVLFGFVLYSSDYPYATERMLISVLVLVVTSALLARARAETLAFAARAVELSVVDPLTGAANLRGLRQRVADEITRSDLTGKHVAVLGIDIDDFKSVNDTYSHARGDSVLRATVEATRECLRADELVARRGGDEFAAVCAVREVRDAELIAGRIRETIVRARLELCPDLLPTASVAVTIREPGEPVDEFLARVDDCLHAEKQLSRERRDSVLMTA
jgi:diguanylate cyclase (GGDEF)-like protein